ncbi:MULTISPECIES: DUF3597 domain-containing protein [Nitrosomonas]|uniref:Oxidoreductase n=1 Tax=Nitrosomonas communis TaxID=44574 RepID=A0A0F7KEP8_9PROT|nr:MULTISPECIES: DUF3597 domain-containing protein [Nitrosomonas]AKH37638.1 oxidoreductase [Nitrosomonas communis]TYP81864.1 uncharacterized protein DUF3597 [Nitrosomonas communis]UVS62938.1 DUF3597 domain-containing protein [Nitrosomonas sp. PLL12]
MSIFSTILEKLGLRNQAKRNTAQQPTATSANPSTSSTPSASGAAKQTAPKAVPISDVFAQLEQRAAANPQKLDWRNSIVDLLKLLEIDSSLSARKELATELGCPPELMTDSAKMNMWLHKTVLVQIAANGGNIPKELLD